ncbi:hypothetical protein J5N97_005903 [Dioscorea zingiberensis]|uniref:Uncharacterized protein n=1 Tax=Dioscorea zingiberensis TaxID=325984 RepID=A0A9D5DC19_9LILI|nr:hypothetical protein J5N97_005903 [Dioscorea zingiberensis]
MELDEILEHGLLESKQSMHLFFQGSEFTGDGSVDLHGNPVVKNQTGNWRACLFILGNACCERLAFFGIAMNLVIYLTRTLHQSNVSAARNTAAWEGTCHLTPLIGAVLADAYWGRFRTIAIFSGIYFLGMSLLTLSATMNSSQYSLLFMGLYLVALGTGGIKPCVVSFGADQFDYTNPVERENKPSFFNWFYFTLNIGGLIASSFLVWVQDNYGWGLGFGIPTFSMALAILFFLSGTSIYRHRKPGGSPLTRICQVVVASIRKWNVNVPHDLSLLYELSSKTSAIEGSRKLQHTDGFSFLDKAATIANHDVQAGRSLSNPWRLCTVTQVEELKILLRLFPILATSIAFAAVCSQHAMFVEQGLTLNSTIGTTFSIPPASLSAFNIISVIICVPLYDKFLVPLAKTFTGNERGFSSLQRIGIGQVIGVLVMATAATVEKKRLNIVKAEGLVHQKTPVSMSILWQVPQYFLTGAGEVFATIGQLEFFYDQSPDAMRSLCNAFALLSLALGNYFNSMLLTLVRSLTTRGGNPGWIPDCLNEGHLDYYFWLLAGINVVNFLVYVCCAIHYKFKSS